MTKFLLIHLFIFAYLLLRFVLPLRSRRSVKVAVAFVLLLISQHYLIRMFFGSMSTPEVPSSVIIFEGWCFAALIFLFALVLLSDVAGLILHALKRGRASRDKKFSPDRRNALLAILAAAPAVYGVHEGVRIPRVRSTESQMARLPQALDGLVLVHLTDLHVSPLFHNDWVQAVVNSVNALDPDVILFTGDMVDGLPARRMKDIAPLQMLKAKHGIYGCTGNHEYYSDFRAWMSIFPSLGITMLQNAHTVVNIKGQQLVIAGVTDQVAGNFNLPLPSAEAALTGAPENAFRILLDHRPGNAAHNAQTGFDLQLSGHTHGGHMLGMDRLVARFNEGYVYGWYTVDAMKMYVSSGAGLWNGFPVRIGVPSEIARIVLRSG